MALTVYQLKVVLRDVKPTVWRRVLVPCDATIRTLHETVQLVMGLANCHLHQFIIHGKEYGVAYEGGIRFVDSPDKVRLSDFRFQPHEGFEYVYDLGDNWEHDIGVEKIIALDPARPCPVCIGGAQPCPPEDSGGPWRYMSLRRARKRHRGHRKTGSPGKANDPQYHWPLGKARKTTFLCRYLHLLSLRRQIHEGLNVVENWNSANGFILYGRGGEIATNRVEDQEITVLALHLLQVSLVYINTLMIQRVLSESAWADRMTAEDKRGLTPLVWGHVNPYGHFLLDMNTRLAIETAEEVAN